MPSFEWYEKKAKSNLKKHGIDFAEATQVFFDEGALFELERFVEGEARWQVFGTIGGIALVVVVHTVVEEGMDEVVRIISASYATPRERRRYEQSSSIDVR